jgi:hypothetical protein
MGIRIVSSTSPQTRGLALAVLGCIRDVRRKKLELDWMEKSQTSRITCTNLQMILTTSPLSLYQGRSWAKYVESITVIARIQFTLSNRNPSPPSPGGWPLSWIKQAIQFPEDKMLELRGIDATLYTRFLRGCRTSQYNRATIFHC